jgi:hypothetical protein
VSPIRYGGIIGQGNSRSTRDRGQFTSLILPSHGNQSSRQHDQPTANRMCLSVNCPAGFAPVILTALALNGGDDPSR